MKKVTINHFVSVTNADSMAYTKDQLFSILKSNAIESLKTLASNGVFTHAGKFHADDVVSTIFLKYLGVITDYSLVKRVNRVSQEMLNCLIYDVGKGIFDHHKGSIGEGDDTVTGSRHCALTLLAQVVGFPREFFSGIALRDNCGPARCPDTIGAIVNSMLNGSDDTDKAFVCTCTLLEPIFDAFFDQILSGELLARQLNTQLTSLGIGDSLHDVCVCFAHPISSVFIRNADVVLAAYMTERGYTMVASKDYELQFDLNELSADNIYAMPFMACLDPAVPEKEGLRKYQELLAADKIQIFKHSGPDHK